MAKQRFDPLFNPAPKTKTLETAASIDEIGICPVEGCGKRMHVLTCGKSKIPAYVCMTHRIVLPTKDS